jgi:uncharacterized protein (DUF1778 family)
VSTKKTETLALKVDPNFKDRVLKRAEEENRNLTNFVETVLTKYLDEIDKAKMLIGRN